MAITTPPFAPFTSPNEIGSRFAGATQGITPSIIQMTNFGTPSAQTSTTYVMQGYGAATTGNALYTPQLSTRLRVVWQGTMACSGVDAPAAVEPYSAVVATTAAPAYAAAVVGNASGLGVNVTGIAGTEATGIPFTIETYVTGVTVGSQMWFDLAVKASTGSVTLTNVSLIIQEV